MPVSADRVWQALAHGDRRRILDALRGGPRLTGELVMLLTGAQDDPEARRYAVQRHLKALRESGLVIVTVRGRERANALNGAALYQATIGWLDPVSQRYAHRLDALQQQVRQSTAGQKETPMDIRHVDVTQRIDIAATAAAVWDALTGDASGWWGYPYTLIEGAPTVEVEPRLGGLVRERLGSREALWGIVSELEPGAWLGWTGRMGMGAAVTGTVTFTISTREEDGSSVTTVEVRHESIGAVGEGTQAAYQHGWGDLLHRVRALVERGERFGTAGANAAPPDFVPSPA